MPAYGGVPASWYCHAFEKQNKKGSYNTPNVNLLQLQQLCSWNARNWSDLKLYAENSCPSDVAEFSGVYPRESAQFFR